MATDPSLARSVGDPGSWAAGLGASQPATKTQFVVAALREAILAGRIRPGEELNVVHLSKELGVSPTPVREAVRTLQAEGLIEQAPHHRVAVADLSQDDIEELFMLRRILEPLATRLAVERITDAQIAELRALHDAHRAARRIGSFEAMLRTNIRWHFHLYDVAQTRYLRDIISRLWHTVQWGSLWVRPKQVKESMDQHEALMAAIAARDAARAAELMEQHIVAGLERQLIHRDAARSAGEKAAGKARGRTRS